MLRKVLLLATIIFLHRRSLSMSLIAAILVGGAYLVLHVRVSPYIDQRVSDMDTTAQTAVLLTQVALLAKSVSDSSSMGSIDVMVWFCVAINAAVMTWIGRSLVKAAKESGRLEQIQQRVVGVSMRVAEGAARRAASVRARAQTFRPKPAAALEFATENPMLRSEIGLVERAVADPDRLRVGESKT